MSKGEAFIAASRRLLWGLNAGKCGQSELQLAQVVVSACRGCYFHETVGEHLNHSLLERQKMHGVTESMLNQECRWFGAEVSVQSRSQETGWRCTLTPQ